MAYPKTFIDELKARNDIADTVGRYVELKRSGSNRMGLCPFHSEKSPSFTVFSDHFHCFGCGAGGDVITFIMKMENLEYPDAIRFLADRAGIAVPDDGYSGGMQKKKETLTRERGYLMNKLAARHFHENLIKSPLAAEAREYIAKRKLESATVRHFGLGFALNDFRDLYDYLHSEGFTDTELEEGFLCKKNQYGKYFDIFRNRIMFPIIDTAGNIVAFGGRVMDDSKPKYLNSGDTPVFKKSRNLFAMNFAKNAALGDKGKADEATGESKALAGKLIMCEGYMDVIALHQAGFTNAVATLGTAVTPEHARFVSRYAKTVFLAYDSDGAGKNATHKAVGLLSEVGIDAKVIVMNGAKDPDEYIKTYGKAAFARLLDGSVGQVDWRFGEIMKKYNLNLPDEKIRAVSECCTMLAGVYPEFKRDIYIARLCETTGVSKASAEAEIRRVLKKQQKEETVRKREGMLDEMRHFRDDVNPDAAKFPRAADIEEKILGILLLYPELIPKAKEKLTTGDFLTGFGKRLYEKLTGIPPEEFEMSLLNEYFNPAEMGRIQLLYEKRKSVSGNGPDVLDGFAELLLEEKRKDDAKSGKTDWQSRIAAVKEKKLSNRKDKP